MAAPTDPKGFVNWLIKAGVVSGNLKHYTEKGHLKPDEFAHMVQVAQNAAAASLRGVEGYDPNFGRDFYTGLHKMGAIKGDLKYFTSGDVLADDATLASVAKNAGAFFNAKAAANAPPAGPAQGVPSLKVLTSPKMQWSMDSATKKWYARYLLPGSATEMLFEATPEQMKKIFGGTGIPPNRAGNINFNELIKREQSVFGGSITEMEGSGSFEQHYQDVLSIALDQRSLPDWITKDPKALAQLFITVSEERTDDWFYESISGLASFKKRYPGLEKLTGAGMKVNEAVKAFTEYEIGLKQLHAAAGFHPDGVTNNIVGNLLTKGYNLQAVEQSYATWKRMGDNAPALAAFNQILQAQGKSPLTQSQMYNFLQGTAPAELYDTYEASAIQEAAASSGFGGVFTAEDSLSLALHTTENLSVDAAYQQFTAVAQQALRFRHELDVGKYGIDIDDIIDVSFGRAPRSGKGVAEIGEALSRASLAAEAALGRRAAPFTGFTDEGLPQQRSLSRLRQEQ